ncbi:uncharacterized protein LOC133035940 [Cannabis sativa]|uniref:uncharacterized protein LOC133035940 n=1 Tax=Cannabis sativa TaxID=3483 RepID=UPI0029CA38AA|nr:uncharacterized protein LOC133035940 [Cannabis sativa]
MRNTQTLIDAAAGGAFMRKSANEAFELLEEMSITNQQWSTERGQSKKDAEIKSPIQVLETKVGQLASQNTNRAQLNFPSTNEVNPKENSPTPKKKKTTDGLQQKETSPPISIDHHLKIPYPERLRKNNMDKQFSKFLEVFKKLSINIPFAKALEQMPSYVKFMKEILSKKRKMEEFETVALTEECSAILQKKLPPKLKDPRSFTIPCTIGKLENIHALCDLG